MSEPKCSIIITTYNRPELLRKKSLRSALRMYHDFNNPYEIIVVDDGSDYDILETVKQALEENKDTLSTAEVLCVKHEKNYGLPNARNTGVKFAKGKYIAFLDDDDELQPGFLFMCTTVLDTYPEYNVVVGQRGVDYEDGIKFYDVPDVSKKALYTTLDDGFLARREIFDKIQYDDLYNEDADFGIQYAKTFGIETICPVLNILLIKQGHRPVNKDSMCSVSPKVIEGMEKFLTKNLHYYYEHKEKGELEYILKMAGRMYCLAGNMRKGISYILQAIWTMPTKKNIRLLCYALLGRRFFSWRYEKFTNKQRHY